MGSSFPPKLHLKVIIQIKKLVRLINIFFTDIFEEALRRTMQVINGARDEIVRIISPKQPEKFLLPSEKAPAGILIVFYIDSC